jgi:hypothetical protein
MGRVGRDSIDSKADRRRLADKMAGSTKKEWKKAKPAPAYEAPEWRYRMVLNPDVDVDSPAWEELEARLEAIGLGEHGDALNGTFDIVRKVQSRFADVVYFDTRDTDAALALSDWPEIDSVSRVPRLERKGAAVVPLGMTRNLWGVQSRFSDVGEACSASQTYSQATKVDTVQGAADVENIGGGVAVIVWDFLPAKASSLVGVPEFDDRAGGSVLVFDNGSDSVDNHGTTVASTCCGSKGGLATGSNLAMLGITDDIEADLAEIDEAVESLDVPVVVNMSFGLTWENLTSERATEGVRLSIRYLNDIVTGMKRRHPQLTFVAAAGNESVNPCDTTVAIDWDGCRNCLSWPQFAFGAENPILMIGATAVYPTNADDGRALREYAPYSNFGSCIDAWSHGGAMCGWDIGAKGYRATQGTSFASPLFSSMVALGYSKYPGRNSDEIVDLVKGSMTTSLLQGIPAGSGGAFAVLPEDFKTGGSAAVTNPSWNIDVINPADVPDPPSSDGFPIWIILVIVAVIVVIIIGAYVYMKSRKGGGGRREYREERPSETEWFREMSY